MDENSLEKKTIEEIQYYLDYDFYKVVRLKDEWKLYKGRKSHKIQHTLIQILAFVTKPRFT